MGFGLGATGLATAVERAQYLSKAVNLLIQENFTSYCFLVINTIIIMLVK